jgi:putative endonuclease
MTDLLKAEDRRRRYRHGIFAEYAAASLLMLKGYRVLNRRWRCKFGEIDLVVVRGKRLAFVEVKQRRTLEDAQFSISDGQAARIKDAADLWLQANPRFRDFDLAFDAVYVVKKQWPLHVEHAL